MLNVGGRGVLRMSLQEAVEKSRTKSDEGRLERSRTRGGYGERRETLLYACLRRTRRRAVNGAAESRRRDLRRVLLCACFRAAIHAVLHPRHVALVFARMQRHTRDGANAERGK